MLLATCTLVAVGGVHSLVSAAPDISARETVTAGEGHFSAAPMLENDTPRVIPGRYIAVLHEGRDSGVVNSVIARAVRAALLADGKSAPEDEDELTSPARSGRCRCHSALYPCPYRIRGSSATGAG